MDFRGALNPMTGVLIRKREGETSDNETGEKACEDRSRSGLVFPQTKEQLEPLARGKQGISLRDFRGSLAMPTPGFYTPSLQNYKIIHFCFSKPLNLW